MIAMSIELLPRYRRKLHLRVQRVASIENINAVHIHTHESGNLRGRRHHSPQLPTLVKGALDLKKGLEAVLRSSCPPPDVLTTWAPKQ